MTSIAATQATKLRSNRNIDVVQVVGRENLATPRIYLVAVTRLKRKPLCEKCEKKNEKKTWCVSTEVEVPIKDLTLCNH